jgi:hypothetical protein
MHLLADGELLMRARTFSSAVGSIALAGCCLVACSMVVDVDRFHEKAAAVKPGPRAAGASGQFLDLVFTVEGMKPHLTHQFEYRVIDANNLVQSRGVLNALGTMNVTITAPKAIPKSGGPYRLDFYADVNGSGGYDGIGSVISQDHAWRIEPLVDYPEGAVTPIEGVVQVVFTHSTSFTDVDQHPSGTPNKAKDTGLGASVRLTSFGEAVGKTLLVRIAEKETGHVVGLARLDAIKDGTVDLKIPGVVDVGVDYDVEVYVDKNGNQLYDNPSQDAGDWGLRASGASTESGLVVSVDAMAVSRKEDVGGP